MNNRKLKDLKKGDRVWLLDFARTTPIFVESSKREGSLMRLTIKWDDEVFDCYGPALGFVCIGYWKRRGDDILLTCQHDISYNNELRIEKVKDLLPLLKELIDKIEKI